MADTHVSVVAVDVLSAPTTYVFAVISIANVFRAGFGIRAAKKLDWFLSGSAGLPNVGDRQTGVPENYTFAAKWVAQRKLACRSNRQRGEIGLPRPRPKISTPGPNWP